MAPDMVHNSHPVNAPTVLRGSDFPHLMKREMGSLKF